VTAGPDIGFVVPDGDPARLSDAARWHESAADDFDRHAALIDHTAGSLAHVWRGAAADGYQTRSGGLAVHFRIAADSSRAASTILLRYAHELDVYQQEGRRCLAEAEHWHQRVEADRATLARAEQAVRAAESAIAQAQNEVRAAGALAHPAAAATLADAHGRLADAQGRLAAARAAVRDAQRDLRDAEDELHRWQARGRQVWQEAHDVGSQVSRALATLTVPSPPPSATPPPATPTTGTTGSPATIPAAAAVGALASSGVAGASAGLPAGAGSTAGGPGLAAVAGGATQGAISFGDLEEIGRRFGWSHAELQAWWQVISDESGGNPHAVNASSGAFGIGQFLGQTYKEYLPFGAGSSNPLDQLNAMAHYIRDRYGSPMAALAHECSCHWY
jgi:hypothetical protein